MLLAWTQWFMLTNAGICAASTPQHQSDLNSLLELFEVSAQLKCWTAKLTTFHMKCLKRSNNAKQILVLIACSPLGNSFSPISLCQHVHPSIFVFLHRRRLPNSEWGITRLAGPHPTASPGVGAATHHRNLGCSKATSMTQVRVSKWSGTRRHVTAPPPPTPGQCTCT